MTDQPDKGRVADHYAKVDHPAGPAIYTRADLHDAIFDLGNLRALVRDGPNSFLDLMSGPKCLVGSEVRRRAEKEGIDLTVYCFDIAFGKMPEDKKSELRAQGYRLATGDATKGTGYKDGGFDSAASRFGVKNYQPDTQSGIFREVRRVLVPNGHFVLADMVASEVSYEWLQEERRRKSRHTVGEENAEHHIPTRAMWCRMLREAGLEPKTTDVYETKSLVATTDWVKSKQMSEDGMRDMNEFLLSAPDAVKKDMNIREEEVDGKRVVRIDYPVVVIAARSV